MAILANVRVIDVTYGIAGPLATQVLADQGAGIIRVDAPGAVRRQPDDLVRLRGRRSITVDCAKAEGQALIERLAAAADVLISEPGLDGRDPVERDYAGLSEKNPRLIYCRITGYGDEGPLAGSWAHDHLVAARYGVYDQAGWRDGPTYLTAPVPSLGAGLLAVQAIGSALYFRERTGKGQEVTTSLLAGALAFQPGMISASVDRPMVNPALFGRSPLGAAPFYSIYECGDGNWLHFGCLTAQFQQQAIQATGLETELTDLGFGTPQAMENRQRIIEAITARLKEKPYAAWAALFEEMDVPHAPAQWTEDLLDDPQVKHERMVISVLDPLAGPMDQMGPTVTFEAHPWQQPGPAPRPGEHTDAICRELGIVPAEIEALRRAGAIL